MTQTYFITGSDTAVGKTLIATALVLAFKNRRQRVAGFKPVSAGCEKTPEGLRNADAVQLRKSSSVNLSYELINPYAFEAPVAPHIAASEQGLHMHLDRIVQCYKTIAEQVDVVIVEGAGGWMVPLNAEQTMADVAKAIAKHVVLVVDMKLGCLNHALLTANSIADAGLTLAGWVANSIESHMPYYEQNIETLATRLSAPLIGQVDFISPVSASRAADFLKLDKLLSVKR